MAEYRLPPRQKMINLVYVILIAMLAINISADTLDTYSLLGRTSNDRIEIMKEYNGRLLEKVMEVNPEYAAHVTRIDSAAMQAIAFTDTLKEDIARAADKKKYTDSAHLKAKEDLDAVPDVMLSAISPKGLFLKQKIDSLKEMFLESGISDATMAAIGRFLELEATGKHISWANETFRSMPAIGGIAYINSIQAFLRAMVMLVGSGGEIMGHGALMQPYLDLLDWKEEETLSDAGVKMPESFSMLSFEHVYFRYPGQESWVLEDVTFTLKADQKMALVGENGSGKSTLIKLICRFYEPDRGAVKIDGVDIRRYDKKQYWDRLSVVFQDFSLPALPLGNVISGREDFDKEKEMRILQEIGMDRWMEKLNLSFEQCIYNDFSDSGIEVSGGESQKLAIARAVYKDAPFIILDEPTAALDPVSEASVFNDFHRMCEGKTGIFISHRLYSCRICDFILVLHKGRLLQQGTHEELLGYGGKYKELWDAQAGLYKEMG